MKYMVAIAEKAEYMLHLNNYCVNIAEVPEESIELFMALAQSGLCAVMIAPCDE